MIYTVEIDQTNKQALSIINMLKALSLDSNFLKIYEKNKDTDTSLTFEQDQELNSRYEQVIKNPTIGKSWEEVEQNLLSK